MSSRLRDVVALQHRRLLTAIDRAESAPDDGAIRKMRKILLAHLDAEELHVYPVSEAVMDGSRYGREEHVLIRFALDRITEAKTNDDRSTRIRVLRDLLVHHIEREEWVTLQLLEQRLAPAKYQELGRRIEDAFAPAAKSVPPKKRALEHQLRRKER